MKKIACVLATVCAMAANGAFAADTNSSSGLLLVTLPATAQQKEARTVYMMAPIVSANDRRTPLPGATSAEPHAVPVPKPAPISGVVAAQAEKSPIDDVVSGAVQPIKKIYWFFGGR